MQIEAIGSILNWMSSAIAEIELLNCLYEAGCRGRGCHSKATIIARSFDAGGRPVRQYELCPSHAERVVERELNKGRKIIDMRGQWR
jgi:hypothetical protein